MSSATHPSWRGYRLADIVEAGGRIVTYRAERAAEADAESDRAADPVPPPSVLVRTMGPGIRPSAVLIEALERESKRLRVTSHPLLPRLIAVHLDEEAPGLVLDDARGHRLDGLLTRVGELDVPSALAICVEVARALSHLHAQGAVHGRLRAAHVELCAAGTIRLHGFAGTDPAHARERADDDLLLGPTDLAPEQVAGGSVDARTDVYLLGLLLAHMLARDPQPGRGPSRRARVGGPRGLRPALLADPRLVLPGARLSVDQLLARCLCRRASDRVADMPTLSGLLVAALRAETTAPIDLLIGRVLHRGGLGDEPAASLGDFPGLRRRIDAATLRRVAAALALVLLGGAAAVWVFSGASGSAGNEGTGVRGVEQRAGQLRVLAQPWAEVHVDGKLVDTTPIGRPIEVAPGRHEVRFKHPNAPDELRTVEVIAGQTVWIDVTMPVTRPPRPTASASGAASESP